MTRQDIINKYKTDRGIKDDSKAVAKQENRSFNNLLENALIAYRKGKM